MSENTTASLKQEILEWANKPGTMDKFTTHDVYEYIHSAETPSHTSDALRSMWKYDKTLDREEFMDGNKKRFVYSLKKEINMRGIVNEKRKEKPKSLAEEYMSGIGTDLHLIEPSTHGSINTKIRNFEEESNNNQQIEIPNNFCIELKTPNGFTITIKAGDLMK